MFPRVYTEQLKMKLLQLFIVVLLVIPVSYSNKLPINQERLKLIEDALSWLTLRAGGELLDPQFNSQLVRSLHLKYNNSLYFRTIVIAFQFGVLPKLTLQQGQSCDPSYTLRYRSELNNSVTWYRVKNFTFQNYYDLKKPGSQSGDYCDYRQGLVCLPTTKTCDCPEGSKMGPIEKNSQVQRCLLEEDEICPLADLNTYRDITILIWKLPELIFNLEKPQSCKHGTTCRVKDSNFTKCLSVSKAPFLDNNGPSANYGEECIIDYVGEGGGCSVETYVNYRTNICFNFRSYVQNKRLSSSSIPNRDRTGLCASDFTPYMTPGISHTSVIIGTPTRPIVYPFITAFVNPGTVKMPSSELLVYDKQLHNVTDIYNWDMRRKPHNPGRKRRIQRDAGEPCSVTDTAKMVDIWNFFASLEKNPPQGQDYVADVPTLQAKLAEYKNLIENHIDFEPRICRIYWDEEKRSFIPPLTCVSTGVPPDAKGNDGTCQISSNNDTFALLSNLVKYTHDDYKSKNEVFNEDQNYDQNILLDNPEVQCIQSQRQRRFRNSDDHSHGDVLDGGNCTEGFACIEDFNEIHGIYKDPKKRDCSLVDGYQPRYACLDVLSERDNVLWNSCEERFLNQRIIDAVQTAPKLGMGATCNSQLANEIDTFYEPSLRDKTNRYRILLGLEISGGICDPTKLLSCTKENICGCGQYLGRRESADKMYFSDYCYVTIGPCSSSVSEELVRYPLTAAEKAEMDSHYGEESSINYDSCENGNMCKFINACERACTDVNTGSTGFDVDVVGGCVPTTTIAPTSTPDTLYPSSIPLEPVRPFVDGATSLKKQSQFIGKAITIIIILRSLYISK